MDILRVSKNISVVSEKILTLAIAMLSGHHIQNSVLCIHLNWYSVCYRCVIPKNASELTIFRLWMPEKAKKNNTDRYVCVCVQNGQRIHHTNNACIPWEETGKNKQILHILFTSPVTRSGTCACTFNIFSIISCVFIFISFYLRVLVLSISCCRSTILNPNVCIFMRVTDSSKFIGFYLPLRMEPKKKKKETRSK